jgi:hypothetical protein
MGTFLPNDGNVPADVMGTFPPNDGNVPADVMGTFPPMRRAAHKKRRGLCLVSFNDFD